MKVKELIETLNMYDPEEEVVSEFYIDKERCFPDGVYGGWAIARIDEVYLYKYPKGSRSIRVATAYPAFSCRCLTNKLWKEYFKSQIEDPNPESLNEAFARIHDETLDQYLHER